MFIRTKKIYLIITKNCRSDSGLSLVEALAALTIFLVVLGFMIPMFANQRLSTINNEIETGAIAVSQQILDRLRQADIGALPSSGTVTTLPLLSGQSVADSITSVTQMGKPYSAAISYCPNTPTDNYCNSNARHIKVQVSYNAQVIYTVETVYTRFQ